VGIYDRDYLRPERSESSFPFKPSTVVGWIIAVNAAFWLLDAFTGTREFPHWLSDWMGVRVDTLLHPWLWWQFLTAGFAHSPTQFGHMLGNMLVLFFLGRSVEDFYGPKEFLRLYLVMVVFASLAWAVANLLAGTPHHAIMYGASGAISGVVVLFAMNFPHATILLFFVLPMPAWLFGALVVVLDMYGAMQGESNVAYSAHLAGAAFAFVYQRQGWRLSRFSIGFFPGAFFRRKPRLRVHVPDEEQEFSSKDDIGAEVDRILEKIFREGESSLTARERAFLESASRKYRHRGNR